MFSFEAVAVPLPGLLRDLLFPDGDLISQRTRRMYWTGFTLLGWIYQILVYTPWLNEQKRSDGFSWLPNLLKYLAEILHAARPGGGMQSVPRRVLLRAAATAGGFDPGGWSVSDLSDFERIGVALEALLWAFLGGWTATNFESGRSEGAREIVGGAG